MTKHSPTPKKIAINGFGRIGRNVVRAWFESPTAFDFEIVALNDVADCATLAHLLKYDSTHGRFFADIKIIQQNNQECLQIIGNGRQLTLYTSQFARPKDIVWHTDIDLVLECTGLFRSYADASGHLSTAQKTGAKKVIIGAAPFDSVDIAVVYEVNHDKIDKTHRIISSVSCTTQALVPLVKLLDDHFGIESALMTEIHAVTADQAVLDHAHRDLRRARASGQNFIPTTSSAIGALKQVLPNMADKFDGYSVRVPTINVASVDLSFVAKSPISVNKINALLLTGSQTIYPSIMGVTNEPLVSSDFNHLPYSLVADLTQTLCVGQHAKVLAWYDNEWGYANRLLDLCQVIEV